MAPYLIVFFLSLCILYQVEHRNLNSKFLLLAILLPVLLGGLRHPSIGVDTMYYVTVCWDNTRYFDSFADYMMGTGVVEEMYLFVNYALSQISKEFALLLITFQLIMIIPIVYVARNLNIKTHYVFFYYFFVYFCSTLNLTRQSLAMSICLLAFYFLYQEKIKLCIVAMFVAYGFHHSSVLFCSVLLLLYVLKKKPQWISKKSSKILLVSSSAVVLLFFNQLMMFLTHYGLREEYVSRYAESEEFGTNVPISLFALTIFNLLVYYVTTHKRHKDELMIFAELMMLLEFVFCFAGLISTFAVRIGSYFGYITMILLPYCIQRYPKKMVMITATTFYIFYWFMVVVYKDLGEVYPYKSIL